VLATNSYLNVMSVVVSSTVLLYSTISEVRDKKAAEQREALAAQHQRLVDDQNAANAEALAKIQDELRQHINSQLDEIKQILLERLEINHAETSALQKAIIDSANAQDIEVGAIRDMVASLKENRQ
jgi:outer membrane murein-binding lipoprotein Lpp